MGKRGPPLQAGTLPTRSLYITGTRTSSSVQAGPIRAPTNLTNPVRTVGSVTWHCVTQKSTRLKGNKACKLPCGDCVLLQRQANCEHGSCEPCPRPPGCGDSDDCCHSSSSGCSGWNDVCHRPGGYCSGSSGVDLNVEVGAVCDSRPWGYQSTQRLRPMR